ncbi:MAG TPA: hypothetical protein PK890_02625 [Terrimesophilobacter sp.]|nr:hypothetical protein [Terrimesophilobacter sp.]
MKRTRPAVLALGIASSLSILGPAAAHAATAITVDELDPPGVVATSSSVDNPSVTFTGTINTGEPGGIVLFIDGTLVTCEEYFGNDVNEATCYRVASIEGNTWDSPLFQDEVERIGLDLLGVHDFRFARVEIIDGKAVIVTDVTITAEVVEELPVESEPVEPSLPGTPDHSPGDAGTSARSSSQLSTGDPAAPSVLSSVPSVGATIAEPPNLLVAAAVTIILLLLVGLPSTLLGATLSDNYDRIFGRSAAVRRATAPLTRALAASTVPGWLPLALGIVAASILSSFVDPGFGLNWGSARMLLSMALAFAIETLLGWVVIRAVLKRTDPGLDPKPQLKWGSLLIVLVAVILSRLVGFEPGMVFGLIVGLAFGVTLATAQDVRIKLIGIGWAIVIGLVGWVGYSVLSGIDGWLPVLLAETLSGIAVGSLAALPIALLPLRGLDGETLFSWNRWAWAGLYGFGLLLFFVVLMPMPFSWGEVGAPLVTWICLYLGYAALAVGVWAWFRFRPVRVATVGSADSAVGQT